MDTEKYFENLTDEQRAGLAECKTAEETVAYCKEQGIALPDEALEDIAGGMQLIRHRAPSVVISGDTVTTVDEYGHVTRTKIDSSH